MPFLSVVNPPEPVDSAMVTTCRDELMALNRCIDLSGMADEAICAALSIDKGHWSRIRKGRGHFPTKKRLRLMELCGNLLPLQFEALKLGYSLDPISKDEKIKRLERELAAARAA